MKVNLSELRAIVSSMVLEAKSKKMKELEENPLAGTAGGAFGSYSQSLDFSAPLGDQNLYKSQGWANWGPGTSTPPSIDDRVSGMGDLDEASLRNFVKGIISEDTGLVESAWEVLAEAEKVPETPWEDALQHLAKSKKDKK